MENIQDIISDFSHISLDEMENVKLMDRVDSKYVFRYEQLPGILNGMKDTYRLLEINSNLTQQYESLYFDTNDFKLYTQHHNGKLNRHTIRYRRYANSGLTFFEIKFKNNRGRTVKDRVKTSGIDYEISGNALGLLNEITPLSSEILSPKLWVSYSRMTFINKFSEERLTIDYNLTYTAVSSNTEIEAMTVHFPQMVIAESKRDRISSVSPFIRLARENHIREGALSKYCFGVINLYSDLVKINNFKPKARYIYKTIGQSSSHSQIKFQTINT